METIKNKIRTRFAPSPTGSIHLGNIRSALYEYLFAKKNGGEFLLRIEDTDQKRYSDKGYQSIYDSLKWLGLKWDGDVLRQSSRLSLYKDYANDLIQKGFAYPCFCSEERLEELRSAQEKAHLPTGYDRCCRELPPDEALDRMAKKEPHVIRLKIPRSGKLIFRDLIRGEIEFDYSLVDDTVLLKEDGFPTYHLAMAVDDHDMGITHVIRGDEWLSSIPKHLFLYQCFGWDAPEFAHLSIVVGSDKKKLSKREGAISAEEFRKQGYLAEAILNYIVFLGWNPGTEREFFTLAELEKEFDLAKVNKSPAMFDTDKLNHFNAHYIHQMSEKELLKAVKPYSKIDFSKYEESFLEKAVKIVKERMVLLTDFDLLTSYLFEYTEPETEMIKFAKSDLQNTLTGMEKAIESLGQLDASKWESLDELNAFLSQVVSVNGLKNGDVFWPVRVALSSQMASPSPAELLWTLGSQESLRRLKIALVKITPDYK